MSDVPHNSGQTDDIQALGHEIEAAAAAFEAEAEKLSYEIDVALAAADQALEDFVVEIEKGDTPAE